MAYSEDKGFRENLSCGFVGGGGLVCGRSGLVGLGFVLGVDSLAFVFDISDVAVVVVSGVGDSLDATIGQSDGVGSGDNLTVSGLLGVEVGTRVVILDGVGVRVGLGLVVGLGFVGRGGFVGGGRPVNVVGGSNGQEGKSKEGLKVEFIN